MQFSCDATIIPIASVGYSKCERNLISIRWKPKKKINVNYTLRAYSIFGRATYSLVFTNPIRPSSIFQFCCCFNSILCSVQLHNGPHLNCNLVQNSKSAFAQFIVNCKMVVTVWAYVCVCNVYKYYLTCTMRDGNRMNDPSVGHDDAIYFGFFFHLIVFILFFSAHFVLTCQFAHKVKVHHINWPSDREQLHLLKFVHRFVRTNG